jgi:hypothetical protein
MGESEKLRQLATLKPRLDKGILDPGGQHPLTLRMA